MIDDCYIDSLANQLEQYKPSKPGRVEAADLRLVALLFSAYALWLASPATADADRLAQLLERYGVLESADWTPAKWVVVAVGGVASAA